MSAPACRAGSPPWSRGHPPGARDSRLGGRPCPRSPPTPPARDRRLGSRLAGDPCHSRAASAPQGRCSPARWPSSRPCPSPHRFSRPGPRRTGGGRPEAVGSSSSCPEGPSWLHAAVLQRFRYRTGEAAGISNKTQELVCDSSVRIPPILKLSSRSFLGRNCPMFELFLPREDGLKAASWGLFLVKKPLYFKGGDGACAGLSSCPIEELLMFTGYA